MAIRLIVDPRKVVTWKEFTEKYPPFSIALDGFVSDCTKRSPRPPPDGPHANFDHHANSDRLSTRATCEQVRMEIQMGLFDTFRLDGLPEVNIHVNDCDEDTCLAVWALENHERVLNVQDPLIQNLFHTEDRLDVTAGTFPFGNTSQVRKLAWIFEPYQRARAEGALTEMTADGMKSTIEAVCGRINKYGLGEAEEIAVEGHYNVIGGRPDWSMVEETGPAARMAMFAAGITAFVSVLGDGRFVLGKRSVWTAFPLEEIYDALNKAEKKGLVAKDNLWDGSNTVGGSPRKTGSSLTPKRLEAIVNKTIDKYKKDLAKSKS